MSLPAIRFPGGRPWGLAVLWLAFLTPMFFGSYIATLELTALRSDVPTLVFAWEHHIPFLAWTVLPYWSEDFFYGLSLFVCTTRTELNTHGQRLVLAQAIAIATFLLFPLRLTSTIPADTGIWEPWFAALGDVVGKPYNLAPSLHVAIVILLGAVYVRHVPWPWRSAVYVWGFLIGLSTLTAYQHHFFDIPTGAALGVFCIWALPHGRPSPFRGFGSGPRRLDLAALYTTLGLVLIAASWGLGGAAWWLLWPALSVLMVASAYAGVGAALFQKDAEGRTSGAARWLLWPYHLGARISAAAFTRGLGPSPVVDGVSLGRLADGASAEAVVDLAAELPAPSHPDWRALPSLDLLPPAPEVLVEAARHIEARVDEGRAVLVCCALGFSRSAAAVATWLVGTGRASDVDGALATVRQARPRVVLGAGERAAIERAVRLMREDACSQA